MEIVILGDSGQYNMFWITRNHKVKTTRYCEGRLANEVDFWLLEKPNFDEEWGCWEGYSDDSYLRMELSEFQKYFDIKVEPGEIKKVKLIEVSTKRIKWNGGEYSK